MDKEKNKFIYNGMWFYIGKSMNKKGTNIYSILFDSNKIQVKELNILTKYSEIILKDYLSKEDVLNALKTLEIKITI